MAYNEAQLQALIELSLKLGFLEDTKHWRSELKKLKEKEKANA